MSIEVRADITPSLHPAAVAALPGYNDSTRAFVSEVEHALALAYEAIGAVHAARHGAGANPTLNDAARVLVVADFADKHQAKIFAKMDTVSSNLQRSIASMEDGLNGPIEGAAVGGFTAEVRAYCKSLPRADRTAFMAEAMKRSDTKTLSAVLGAPSFLSGFSEAERTVHVRKFHESRQPETVKRLELMKAALELLHDRSPLVMGELVKAVGADHRQVAALRTAKANAEKAYSFAA